MAFAEIGDSLRAEPAETLSLRVTGPFAGGLSAGPDNLVLRAARALATEAGVAAGARIVLEKNLPVASGIGGGSADAAAALRLCAECGGCRLIALCWRGWRADLARTCRPACSDARVVGGIGERLEPAPTLPQCGIVLVNPGIPVARPMRSARGAERGLHGRRCPPGGRTAKRWRMTWHRCATTWNRPPSRCGRLLVTFSWHWRVTRLFAGSDERLRWTLRSVR